MSARARPIASITLADGRRLAYCTFGDPAGTPVLYCHGFPGSRLEAGFAATAAQRTRVRLLAPDRPGFGQSDARGDYPLDAWSDDGFALLDALGIGHAGVLGISGGAPYALACAARGPGRVTAVALIGPLGPVDGPAALAGMSPLARLGFYLAWQRPRLQAGLFGAIAAAIRVSPPIAFRLLTRGLAPADRAVFQQPALRSIWIESLRASVAQGPTAAVAELRRYARPWPFDPATLRPAVMLWHGQADRVVPIAHGRRLAERLARVEAHWPREEGHFSLPVHAVGAALGGLLEAAGERVSPGTARPP